MASPLILQDVRRRVIQQMPNLIADGYESPRSNLQSILQQLSASIADLQRRET